MIVRIGPCSKGKGFNIIKLIPTLEAESWFKQNRHHLQLPLTSHVDELSEKLRKRLETSWSGVFYREFFCRLKEEPFSVLYADCPSRPNVPINVLVGLEYLKAGNGWSDEEMYDAFC
ncbi:MAG: hypothetical protein PHQ40_11835 [Anaerolineaceae bacterium]|nr:hypothetical protein [Anaerolineaceae bacterium]